ncbi:hypothetical protein PsorP6_014931 [Peronosclerospora sorghi]|uniref:Uncharacterized protein n=1 Tax=Peronosclerospora sorghi TaxID=230839 RepID=A0ACC0VU39_9STRA|nr:hypothetical protein PsorP6_014931 [Peronosclerospora sorghi]
MKEIPALNILRNFRYVSTINSGRVPAITSAREGVTASKCQMAITTATETFKKSFSALHLPLDKEDLSEATKNDDK